MNAFYRNHMGNDLEVVNDARISFDSTSAGAGFHMVDIPNCCEHATQTTARIPNLGPSDQNLIQFLARGCRSGDWDRVVEALDIDHTNNLYSRIDIENILSWVKRMPTHWTPFGQQVIKLRMKAPVPIRTQCFKSKIGFVENEESRRYIKSEPEIFLPEYRCAPEGDIKQGSGGPHPHNAEWQGAYREHTQAAVRLYNEQILDGIAPEQARFVLPQGAYVNWVWTGSLYAYAEFYNKRQDGHAQGEIRDLAAEVATIIEPLFPVSWAALTAR